MRLSRLAPLLSAFLVLGGLEAGQESSPRENDDPAPEELVAALKQGLDQPDTPFRLTVHCTGEEGTRALEVFAAGIGIWNGSRQFEVSSTTRESLLSLFLEQNFAAFETSYGGRPETAREPAAALRISCQIGLEIGDVRKRSVQFAEGRQSKELRRLAESLLDEVQDLADGGTGADNLSDGLRKLATGELALEAFGLRFVRLPSEGVDPGVILRIAAGAVSRQTYRPGREVGEPVLLPVHRPGIEELLRTMLETDVSGLPINLWSNDRLEVDVQVLNHRKSLIARSFAGLSPERLGTAQQRFDRLIAALDEFLADR